jgi:hypothetical protein
VSSSKKPDFRGIPTRVARFVSHVSAGVPWYDVHLPLIPVPVRNERLALPSQPRMRDLHESRWMAEAESTNPFSAMVKHLRGDS